MIMWNRTSRIEDTIMHTCSVAPEYNLFSTDKVIVKLVFSKEFSLMMAKIDGITQLADMFGSTTTFIWGISERESHSSDVLVLIIASNINKKNKLWQTIRHLATSLIY